jgi:hypothetical protein
MRNFSMALLVSAIALTASLTAQTHPKFAGDWVMVPDKSDFGPMPKPATMTRTITETGATVKIVTVQAGANGDTTTNMTFTTDGKPQKNTVQGSEMTTTGKWDGAALVFTHHRDLQGSPLTIVDRFALSADGKTLTVTRNFTTSEGSAPATIVFVRKPRA